jgi:hypothetical protein
MTTPRGIEWRRSVIQIRVFYYYCGRRLNRWAHFSRSAARLVTEPLTSHAMALLSLACAETGPWCRYSSMLDRFSSIYRQPFLGEINAVAVEDTDNCWSLGP